MPSYELPIDGVSLVRSFCCLSITIIGVARLVPASRIRFLNYGARAQSTSIPVQQVSSSSQHGVYKILDYLASIDVPHSWFLHFYLFSLILSCFWLFQILTQGYPMRFVGEYVSQQRPATAAPVCMLCVVLMILQGIRRLWESYQFSQGSRSRMWVGQYIFGLAFYGFTNIAIWIEGAHSITEFNFARDPWFSFLGTPRVAIGLVAFAMLSSAQYAAHAHLVTLPKYSIPRHWLFQNVISPHYTAECGIYFALSIIAAPKSRVFNATMLWVTLLTLVNLGITAHGTKMWMISKFRESETELRRKYCMIPGIW